MIMSLPSLKGSVFFIYPCFNMVSFRGQKKPGPRPDWSTIGVPFKISDKHPSPFYMGFPPPGNLQTKLWVELILSWAENDLQLGV